MDAWSTSNPLLGGLYSFEGHGNISPHADQRRVTKTKFSDHWGGLGSLKLQGWDTHIIFPAWSATNKTNRQQPFTTPFSPAAAADVVISVCLFSAISPQCTICPSVHPCAPHWTSLHPLCLFGPVLFGCLHASDAGRPYDAVTWVQPAVFLISSTSVIARSLK